MKTRQRAGEVVGERCGHREGISEHRRRRALATAVFTVLAAIAILSQGARAQTDIITTVAGGGIQNNVPGAQAFLPAPWGLVADKSGNIYVASPDLNEIFKLTPSGQLFAVAGSGVCNWGALNGDGGPATKADLCWPEFIAMDGAGNLFVSDWLFGVIRRVDAATQTITTVAGNGSWCSDSQTGCGDGGPATSAQLEYADGLAADHVGNLYIESPTASGGWTQRRTSSPPWRGTARNVPLLWARAGTAGRPPARR